MNPRTKYWFLAGNIIYFYGPSIPWLFFNNQMVNPHQIPWNHHFPMVFHMLFLWFSYGFLWFLWFSYDSHNQRVPCRPTNRSPDLNQQSPNGIVVTCLETRLGASTGASTINVPSEGTPNQWHVHVQVHSIPNNDDPSMAFPKQCKNVSMLSPYPESCPIPCLVPCVNLSTHFHLSSSKSSVTSSCKHHQWKSIV